MITVIVGNNCKACDMLTGALKQNCVDFEVIHRDSEKGKRICYQHNIGSVPATLMKVARRTYIHIGYSYQIVRYITDFFDNMR